MKLIRLVLPIMAALAIASTASAVTLTYQPSNASMTIEAGSSATFPVAISIAEPVYSTYNVYAVGDVRGTLPASWVQITPPFGMIAPWSPIYRPTMLVTVPSNATPGTYTATISSRLSGVSGPSSAGSGLQLTVLVPSKCDKAPEIKINTSQPVILWPPDHSIVDVTIAGSLSSPAECGTVTARYRVSDEYGTNSTSGDVSLSSGGGFSFNAPVEAWREGGDKDGRLYTITVEATNDMGKATSPVFQVIVPHDRRK